MSTNLSISFQHPGPGRSPGTETSPGTAKIPVQLIPANPQAQRMNVMVPLSGDPATASLPEDCYSVHATLPNGEVVTGIIDSRGQEDHTPYLLQLDLDCQAPDEDTAWAYLFNKPRRPTLRRRAPASLVGQREPLERTASLATPPPLATPQIRIWSEAEGRFTLVPESEWSQATPSHTSEPSPLHLTLHVPTHPRLWLEVQHPDHPSKFVLLPPSPTGRETRCLILPDTPEGEDDPDPWNIIIESGDESAATLLAYLQNGSLSAAQLVAEDFLPQARKLVGGKFRDYSGAIIAGYYLQKINAWTLPEIAGTPQDQWEDWLQNLDERFPAHPDGAVIRAWRSLALQQPDDARQHFLTAARRGLPLFRMGTRLLLDGLEFLASLKSTDEEAQEDADLTYNTDKEIVAALRTLRTHAATVNWGAANTTLHGVITQDASAGSGTLLPFTESLATLKKNLSDTMGNKDWPTAIRLATLLASQATTPDVKARALYNRGVAHGKAGDLDSAIQDYTLASTLADAPVEATAWALYNRSLANRQQGDPFSEIKGYTQVINLPNAPVEAVAKALYNRGLAHSRQGHPIQEFEDYTRVITLEHAPVEEVAKALVNRGVLRGRKDSVRAIQDYTRAIHLGDAPVKQVAKALINRGIAHGTQGDPDQEIADYTRALHLPDCPSQEVARALYNRGLAHHQQGDTAAARADFQAVLRLPDCPPYQTQLAATALENLASSHTPQRLLFEDEG